MSNNSDGSSYVEFLKSVSDWPQPEVWFDPEGGEIVVDWSRSPAHVATVFFGEDLTISRWSMLFDTEADGGRGPCIPPEVMEKIRKIACYGH